MSFLLDIIVVLIILLFAILSAKKGFVCTLIEVLGFFIVVFIAFSISTPIANTIYDNFLEQSFIDKMANVAEYDSENIEKSIDNATKQLPTSITKNEYFKISKQEILKEITKQNVNNSKQLAFVISDSFLKPVIVSLISTIIKLLVLVILFLVVKFLAKTINKLFNFSVIGTINKTLGAILGLFKGAFFVILFSLIVDLVLSFTKDGFLIFTTDTINSSYLFKYFMGFSPFR